MGWNPVKDIGKATKHATHAVISLAKGDVSKAITYAGKVINDQMNFYGAGEAWDRVQTGIGKIFNSGSGGAGEDTTETAIEQLTTEREENKKKRRALYATKGGALGEEVESVGTFNNGRGNLFGN